MTEYKNDKIKKSPRSDSNTPTFTPPPMPPIKPQSKPKK